MMATTIQPSQPSAHYGYPQPPPSPPMDDTPKCSLPSISNLLVMADAGSPTTEQAPQSQPQAASTKSETRPSSSHYASSGPSRGALPPSPPMSSDASFEGYNSPATKAVNHVSAVAGQDYYYETTPPLEDVQRQNVAASTVSRVSVQSQYTQHPMAPSYMTQPPVGSYYPPTISTMPPAQPQISALYYQRPLPQVRRHLLDPLHDANPNQIFRPSPLFRWAFHWHRRREPTLGNTITTSRRPRRRLSRNPKTATSARPAAKPSRGPARSASIATPTRERSLSSALTLAVGRHSASEAT
jgi:hypothetical protein